MRVLMIGWMGLACAGVAFSQEQSYPEIETFAEDITSVVWELRGTNTLKRLCYNGEKVERLDPTGKATGSYESAFLDVGVFRLDFGQTKAGWYFVSDDLKWITPTNVTVELRFVPAEGAAGKPIRSFPEDIDGVVWASDPEDGVEVKFGWDGKLLTMGRKVEGQWFTDRYPYVSAGMRRMEVIDKTGARVWLCFTEDGSECWFLGVQDVFGGHRSEVIPVARREAKAERLTPQHSDLADHAEDLADAGEAELAATVYREFELKLPKYRNGHEEQLAELKKRLKP